jgi:hypothetical protein
MFKNPFENEVQKFIDDEVNIDSKLKLSQENLIDEIRLQIKVEKLSKIEKLNQVREYPTPETFALFAWKVYENLERGKLPDGWKLLTTATNKDLANGYVGAAFIHPENHHVVVAHRGTEVTNIGSVVTDLAGIVLNFNSGQLESACTFLEKVANSMKTVEKELEGDVHFELFITGHSLGAWLSQVTAFSNSFLNRLDDKFKRIEQETEEPYHAQAVVFDSPGGLPMLLRLKTKFETVDNPIHLDSLSITSYLSAPNQVNTCNEHFGRVFRVFVETSKMNFLHRNIGYTLITHSIENIVKALDSEKDTKVEEILEWPLRDGLSSGEDLDNFLKHADHRNRYHIGNKIKSAAKQICIRYKTKKIDKSSTSISVFNKREKQFLEHFRWIKQMPEYSKFRDIFHEAEISLEIEKNLECFDIVNKNIHIKDSEKMKIFVPFVKVLLKLFPKIAEKVQKLLKDTSTRAKVFAFESKICLTKNDLLEYKPMTLDISDFMKKQFGYLNIVTGKARNGLSLVYKTFEKSEFRKNYRESELLVLDIDRFLMLNELIDSKEFFETTKENFLVMVCCEDNSHCFESAKKALKNVFDALNENSQVKLILIGESENERCRNICTQAKLMLQDQFFEIKKCLTWNDLTEESHEKVLNNLVHFQGQMEKLQIFLLPTTCLNEEALQQLLNNDCLEINMDPLVLSNFSVYDADHGKKEIKSKIILESLSFSEDIHVISGLYDENLKVIAKTFKEIFQSQDKLQESLIEQNIVIADEKFDESRGKLHIISIVGSERCLQHFDDKSRINNNNKTVHWIKIKDGKLSWRKSYNFDAYVNRKLKVNSKVIKDFELCCMKDKVVAVIGKSGEGKSSFLTHFAREKMKTSWIVCLNFKDLSFFNLKTDSLNHESFAAFIANSLGYDSDNH